MNKLKLYNFLSREVEEFKPINPSFVGYYTCGPTVYDFAHIGNLRTYVFEDVLQRALEVSGYEVKRVMNLTDIDDKIIKNAKEKGKTIEDFIKPYEKAFYEDLEKLNIKPANIYPKATEHVGAMIKYITLLIDKGLAYVEDDGSVYFDISEFPDYGKLSHLDKKGIKPGARISSDEYSRDDPGDFALWKSVLKDEVGYDSPWGRGRPGWHIECSVMSQQYLGDTFDIHSGAIDLLFPHHENEIAQAEGTTGKKFVNYFVEGEHLLVDGEKMSKSLGNFFTLRNVEEKNFDPLAFRYLMLTGHYRDRLNFTWESLQSAQNALDNLREEIRGYKMLNRATEQPKASVVQFWQRFLEAASYDLGMPQALAILWELVKSEKPTEDKSVVLLKMDEILGLKLDEYLGKPLEIPTDVKILVEEREDARKNKDFNKSDQLRDKIQELGYDIEDTPDGAKIKKKNG